MDECNRNEIDSRDSSECTRDTNWIKKNTRDFEKIMNNVMDDKHQEVEVESDSENIMNNAIEDRN